MTVFTRPDINPKRRMNLVAQALAKTNPAAAARYREGIQRRLDIMGWVSRSTRNNRRSR